MKQVSMQHFILLAFQTVFKVWTRKMIFFVFVRRHFYVPSNRTIFIVQTTNIESVAYLVKYTKPDFPWFIQGYHSIWYKYPMVQKPTWVKARARKFLSPSLRAVLSRLGRDWNSFSTSQLLLTDKIFIYLGDSNSKKTQICFCKCCPEIIWSWLLESGFQQFLVRDF